MAFRRSSSSELEPEAAEASEPAPPLTATVRPGDRPRLPSPERRLAAAFAVAGLLTSVYGLTYPVTDAGFAVVLATEAAGAACVGLGVLISIVGVLRSHRANRRARLP